MGTMNSIDNGNGCTTVQSISISGNAATATLAATTTTNANLTGEVTSVGNATTIDQSKLFASYVATALAGSVDLTNTTTFPVCPTFISVSFNNGISKIRLPSTAASNSAKKGKLILIENTGIAGQEFSLIAQDNATPVGSTIGIGTFLILELTDTTTANGTWKVRAFNNMSAQRSDSIFITGGSLAGITSLGFSGSNQSNLSNYEEFTHPTTFTWSAFTSPSQDIKIGRIGRCVNVLLPALSFSSSQTGALSSNTVIPTRFLPPFDICFLSTVYLSGSGTATRARFVLTTTGTLFIQSDTGAAFSAATSILVNSGTFSYQV